MHDAQDQSLCAIFQEQKEKRYLSCANANATLARFLDSGVFYNFTLLEMNTSPVFYRNSASNLQQIETGKKFAVSYNRKITSLVLAKGASHFCHHFSGIN